MANNRYITLTSSDDQFSFRFKAINMSMPRQRTDSIDYTLSGKIDKQAGPVLKFFNYVLRVPQDDQGNEYGCMANLTELFDLVNPNGTPTDVITLTDHYENEFNCYFLGEMVPEPLTTQLEGSNAWYLVPIKLQVKE
jgi:hypothetical protein